MVIFLCIGIGYAIPFIPKIEPVKLGERKRGEMERNLLKIEIFQNFYFVTYKANKYTHDLNMKVHTPVEKQPPFPNRDVGYFENQENQYKASRVIHDWFAELTKNNDDWENSYLKLENGVWMATERTRYEWQDHNSIFEIHIFPKKDMMYFKLMPVGMRYTYSCGYDGVFSIFNENREDEYIIANGKLTNKCKLEYVDDNMYMYIQ